MEFGENIKLQRHIYFFYKLTALRNIIMTAEYAMDFTMVGKQKFNNVIPELDRLV